MEHAKARIIADAIVGQLLPYSEKIEVAGSLRRNKSEVGDIEIVCIIRQADILQFIMVCDQYEIIKGRPTGRYMQLRAHGINVDLFIADEDNWGYILVLRTGPAAYSKALVAYMLPRRGYLCRDGYVFHKNSEIMIPIRTEEALFKMIGTPFIKPEFRL